MGMLKLLDCTLRDGGYVNDWNFGQSAIEEMVHKLEQTKVEILELGFIKDEPYSEDRTVFNDIDQVKKLIPQKVAGIEYAVMAEVVNPLPLEKLPPADADGPDIIRVIVWKRMLREGFEYCKGIVEKGYKLCVQPARVSQYSDEEFIEMVDLFNRLDPMAVYVVDSWGTMYADALLHYMKLADEHLNPGIAIGYHGHNNMMQAFDVARAFARQESDRDIFIDASVYGIGRGAGNLNLELFAKYLNDTQGKNYNLAPMMQIYDKYIKKIYEKHEWGFSLPYFISAKYNCNPNYAEYYNKNDLKISEIERVISDIRDEDRIIFEKERSEKYLQRFMPIKWNKKLAIIILTSNRSEAINSYVATIGPIAEQYGIDIIILDSSNDNKTYKIVQNYDNKYVKYDRYDGIYNGISIDEKLMYVYKNYSSKYEYLWPTRDGVIINLAPVLKGIQDKIFDNYDMIVVDLKSRDYRNHGEKIYTDCCHLFFEQCHQMTVLGSTIIKSEHAKKMVDSIALNSESNLGIWQTAALFQYISDKDFRAASWVGNLWLPNIAAKPSSFWHKQVLWQWGKRWYEVIMSLPEIYEPYKKSVLKFELIDCKPFSVQFLANVRTIGGLSIKKVNKYKFYIPYVCTTNLWKFYAIALLPRSYASNIIKRIIRLRNNWYHFVEKHLSQKTETWRSVDND